MKKKIIKIGIILSIAILIFTYASYGFTIKDLTGTQTQVESLKNAGNNIVKVITSIGVVISVMVLIILGIKYMMGSVEEKAEYKKTLLPYLIGASLVFGASVIAQLIYDLAIQIKV